MSKKLASNKFGIYLALLTALISGGAIFINGWAIKSLNPLIFTTAKNLVVALFLISLLIGLRQYKTIAKLTATQWLYLVIIGLVGGSVPFLLFFKGLSLAGAVNGAFIHKTLFIWVTVLAVVFLKEKLTIFQILGIILLAGGNLMLLKTPENLWGSGQILIWLAVGFWTIETILVKHFFTRFKSIPSPIPAAARMFFGGLIMTGYLTYIGQAPTLFKLDSAELWWILITALILLGYVLTWYGALKHAPASVVTSVLVLGSPITALLTAIFIKHQLSWQQAGAVGLFALGAILMIKAYIRLRISKIEFRI